MPRKLCARWGCQVSVLFFSYFTSNLNENLPGNGRQALYEKIIEALSKTDANLELEVKYQLVHLAVGVLARKGSELKLSRSSQVRPLVFELLNSGNKEYKKTAGKFMMQFSDRE